MVSSVALVGLSLGLGVFVLLYVRRVSEKLYRLTESLGASSGRVATLSQEVCSSSETTAEDAKRQAAALVENAASGESGDSDEAQRDQYEFDGFGDDSRRSTGFGSQWHSYDDALFNEGDHHLERKHRPCYQGD